MKKILSIILITACLACGCSSASGTGKNTSKSTASEPESIDFFCYGYYHQIQRIWG